MLAIWLDKHLKQPLPLAVRKCGFVGRRHELCSPQHAWDEGISTLVRRGCDIAIGSDCWTTNEVRRVDRGRSEDYAAVLQRVSGKSLYVIDEDYSE